MLRPSRPPWFDSPNGLILSEEQYKLWKFSLCNFLHLLVISLIYRRTDWYKRVISSPPICVPRIFKSKSVYPGRRKHGLFCHDMQRPGGNLCSQNFRVFPSRCFPHSHRNLKCCRVSHDTRAVSCLSCVLYHKRTTDWSCCYIDRLRPLYFCIIRSDSCFLFYFTLGSYNENFSSFCPSPRGVHVDSYIPQSTATNHELASSVPTSVFRSCLLCK
jgi:hypothetical protein